MSVPGVDPAASRPPLRVIVGTTLALALVFPCMTAPYYLFGSDPARYVELSRSLVHGQGYFYFGQAERAFPPGFPLVLAPVALLDGSFATMARWAAIVGALVFPAVYAFGRSRSAALPIALLTIASAGFLELIIGNPRSEPIYMACSLGLLAWAHQGAARREPSRRPAAFIAAGTVLVLMTVATRSIGLAAIGALALVMLERAVRPGRDGRRLPAELLVPLAAGVVFLALWIGWTRAIPNVATEPGTGDTYLHNMLLMDPHRPELGQVSLLALLARALRNLTIQSTHVAELLTQLAWIKPRWFSPVTAAVLALTTAGLLAEWRRPSRLAAWYFLGYGAILLFWPYDEGTRFLVPVLPLLWIFAIVGAREIIAAASAPSQRLRIGVIAIGSVCLLGAGISLVTKPADFSRQDQVFAAVWVLVVGMVVFGWDRAATWVGALSGRFGRATMIGALTLYAGAGLARTVPQVVSQDREGHLPDPVLDATREASRWISGNTRPDASVQATFPVPIQFATGRKAFRLPYTNAPERLRQSVARFRPDFLVVLRDTQHPYYLPQDSEKFAILQTLFPGAFREVTRLQGSTIYAFR